MTTLTDVKILPGIGAVSTTNTTDTALSVVPGGTIQGQAAGGGGGGTAPVLVHHLLQMMRQ